ncbi:hypothetical protein Mal64_04940 [Pseudobythopirellula maris]|uniref:Flippase-like domain-containing protein n=1 Tax=Pseudobythopirellula maris TaxID=2527991 RepID=A0A5C5ZTF0_9BACT|nr:lysylphosphatidylglycerol synthase domain-containing protein [Pseudobythopirellula maris]TWT90111.1 hypothetical protein Mal64_04940 [Pseudobythopirellula maris]
MANEPPPRLKRVAVALLKLAVVLLVVWFVGGTARDAWRQLTEQEVRVRPLYGVAAGLMFLTSYLPMVWFWRQTLLALGQPAPAGPSHLAFYLSQLGKYVPGKAAVVVIRTERMRGSGGQLGQVAASVFFETLTYMAVGGLIAALLLALGPGEHPRWLESLAAALGLACLTPTLPPVARWLIPRLTLNRRQGDAAALVGLNLGLSIKGWCSSLVAWGGMATSLWLTLAAVGAEPALDLATARACLLSVTLPVVAGFLSLLPAGVMVREGLILTLLAPVVGEGGALSAAVALRLIWVLSEAGLCAILYGVSRRKGTAEADARNTPSRE